MRAAAASGGTLAAVRVLHMVRLEEGVHLYVLEEGAGAACYAQASMKLAL
jgi:hypothetical protein